MTTARRLVIANCALLGAVALHGYDHYRQERGVEALTMEVRAGGLLIAVLTVSSLILLIRHHPRAVHLAAFTGFWVAIGVSSAHFMPHWSAFSDSYSGLGLDAFSWFAAALEAAAGLVLGVLALLALRGRAPALGEPAGT